MNNLIESEKITHFEGMNRRAAVRKVGLGTMLALPVITGLITPRAASAGSCAANTLTDVNNCGSCGNVCNSANATVTCTNGNCLITACRTNFANCSGNPSDGCETNLAGDPLNCRACNNVCTIANGTAACVAGQCRVASCNAGFADCNSNPADGCEIDLQTNNRNCGACFVFCDPGQTCQGGSCV